MISFGTCGRPQIALGETGFNESRSIVPMNRHEEGTLMLGPLNSFFKKHHLTELEIDVLIDKA